MRPKTGARVVVYFDANMPDIRKCHRGCQSIKGYYCRHRFGRNVALEVEPGLLVFTQQNDMQVILKFLHIINRRYRRNRGRRRYILITHDRNFLTDARREHESKSYNCRPRLVWGKDWVQFGNRNSPVRIEVRCIPHSKRDTDLAATARIIRSLRSSR